MRLHALIMCKTCCLTMHVAPFRHTVCCNLHSSLWKWHLSPSHPVVQIQRKPFTKSWNMEMHDMYHQLSNIYPASKNIISSYTHKASPIILTRVGTAFINLCPTSVPSPSWCTITLVTVHHVLGHEGALCMLNKPNSVSFRTDNENYNALCSTRKNYQDCSLIYL